MLPLAIIGLLLCDITLSPWGLLLSFLSWTMGGQWPQLATRSLSSGLASEERREGRTPGHKQCMVRWQARPMHTISNSLWWIGQIQARAIWETRFKASVLCFLAFSYFATPESDKWCVIVNVMMIYRGDILHVFMNPNFHCILQFLQNAHVTIEGIRNA